MCMHPLAFSRWLLTGLIELICLVSVHSLPTQAQMLCACSALVSHQPAIVGTPFKQHTASLYASGENLNDIIVLLDSALILIQC